MSSYFKGLSFRSPRFKSHSPQVPDFQSPSFQGPGFRGLDFQDSDSYYRACQIFIMKSLRSQIVNQSVNYFENSFSIPFRGGSRAAAASKVECFVVIVNGSKHSILDVAAALDPPLSIQIDFYQAESIEAYRSVQKRIQDSVKYLMTKLLVNIVNTQNLLTCFHRKIYNIIDIQPILTQCSISTPPENFRISLVF